MNLTNLGDGDKHIVFDAMWASLRDSLWSSITVPVYNSASHIIRIHVGNNVRLFHTVHFSEYEYDGFYSDDEDDDFEFDDWEDTI
jgi:hypothetical protein